MNNSDDLLASRQLRDASATRTDVLERVQSLKTLTGDVVTTEMVARWYGVDSDAIRGGIVQRHRAELESNGMRVLEGNELMAFKARNAPLTARRYLTVFSRRAVLNVGMLLTQSEVAERVRSYLLNVESAADSDTRGSAAQFAGIDLSFLNTLAPGTVVEGVRIGDMTADRIVIGGDHTPETGAGNAVSDDDLIKCTWTNVNPKGVPPHYVISVPLGEGVSTGDRVMVWAQKRMRYDVKVLGEVFRAEVNYWQSAN